MRSRLSLATSWILSSEELGSHSPDSPSGRQVVRNPFCGWAPRPGLVGVWSESSPLERLNSSSP